jgi:hypothetical protein
MSANFLKALNTLFIETISKKLAEKLNDEEIQDIQDSLTESWQGEDIQTMLKEVITTNLKKEKKEKKTKKTGGPKKGKTAYIFYCMDQRKVIAEQIKDSELPAMTNKEIIAELAVRWAKAKEDKEIDKYTKLAAEDKARYEKEKSEYVPAEGEEEEKKKPKRRTSAYMFFCKENRPIVKAENPDFDNKAVTKELSTQWKNIKEELEGQKYFDMAENQEFEEDPSKPKKSKKTGPKKKKDGPKKAKTAYMFFAKEERSNVKAENPDLDCKELTKHIAQLWKNLKSSDKEKLKYYNAKSKEDKLRYENELKNYQSVEDGDDHCETDLPDDEADDMLSNEQIIKNIINNFGEDANVTLKMIKEKLKDLDIEVSKEEFKKIIAKINTERESGGDDE